jgi:uncharacterized protein (DUF433 family)
VGTPYDRLLERLPKLLPWTGDRITIEPGKMGGQPGTRGHRFIVEHLLTLVKAGWTLEEIQPRLPSAVWRGVSAGARVAAEGQTQEAASAEPTVCDEFRSPARSALPGHRREGDSRWAQLKS